VVFIKIILQKIIGCDIIYIEGKINKIGVGE